MKRFWFEFDFDNVQDIPSGIRMGCGITAFDYDDAIGILKEKVFSGSKSLAFKKIIENIDINTLDAGHVLPNMKSPTQRGVWFPLGYD